MGAFTLARLLTLDALRRPRAVLAAIMLALSAGFIILPSPDASYATLMFKKHALLYSPGTMGVIAGGEFVAFSIVLGMLATSALSPLRIWRGVFGVANAPAWKIALGLWIAAFGLDLFLLTCIFGGALLRAPSALAGNWWSGLWIFFTWSYGLGVAGAAIAATVVSVLALRLATRPALMMGATFVVWVTVLSTLLVGRADIDGQGFGLALLFPHSSRLDFESGFIFRAHHSAGVAGQVIAALPDVSGGLWFLFLRAGIVFAALIVALLLSGPRVKPLVVKSGTWKFASARHASVFSARFGLAGVIATQIWSAPLWALALLGVAFGFEIVNAGNPVSVIALGFAWGLFMLRWPELSEAFEHRGLRSLVQPSVLGPWPIRIQIAVNIALQMAVLASPLIIALAIAGRVHGLEWLGVQIVAAPMLCIAFAPLRGGATMFSLVAMAWWYLMVSGNAVMPVG